jgi:8-oxo-dGTP pyrophosphatase MutT (NUDIX family)
MDPLPENEPKICAWKRAVADAGSSIRSLEPISILRKKNGELLFALLDTDVRAADGQRLPRYLFIRGSACLIVPLIRNRDTGEEKFLMIRQHRIGSGALSLEFPAGMLDNDVEDPVGVACRELSEETGISAGAKELFPLCDRKLYSSAGASDEGIWYFGFIREVSDASWRTLCNGIHGNPDEDEKISLSLLARESAEAEATSLQVRLGFHLFEAYCRKVGAGRQGGCSGSLI